VVVVVEARPLTATAQLEEPTLVVVVVAQEMLTVATAVLAQ
jgi:hypothetical protein